MRRAMQITDHCGELVALCDDGTMWTLTGSAGWLPLEPIPQPPTEAPNRFDGLRDPETGEPPFSWPRGYGLGDGMQIFSAKEEGPVSSPLSIIHACRTKEDAIEAVRLGCKLVAARHYQEAVNTWRAANRDPAKAFGKNISIGGIKPWVIVHMEPQKLEGDT